MGLKTLLFFSFFLTSVLTFGQAKVNFKVKTLNKATQKKEAGVTVKVYDGSTLVSTTTSDASGEVLLNLNGGKKYKVEVLKAGKVTRNFLIDLKNVNDELIQGGDMPKGEIDMSLFDQVPNVDYSYVTSNPATEFYFDPTQSANLLYDDVLAEKMVAKVEKILKDAEAQLKKGDANYNSLIKQADALFTAKKYEEAKGLYEQALQIKQTEKHPNDRVIEIENILKAEKLANQANSQAEEDYKNLIAAADALKNQKKYNDAIAKYREALSKKNEQYPLDQIEICEAAIEADEKAAEFAAKYTAAMKAADGFYAQKSWMAAKDNYTLALKYKAGDPIAKAKLDEIDKKLNEQKAEQDKKKLYNDAIAAGDAFMTQEKWAEAKVEYNKAIAIESASTYPSAKIKEADAKIAEIEKEKAKKEQISKLLAEGNTALTAKQGAIAKQKFEQVIALETGHPEATAKLIEVEKLLADEKANAEKIASAKLKATEGDALAKANKNEEAKLKYQESIALYPDAGVQAKLDAVISKLDADAKKAEQKAKFDQLISAGDAAVAANNFSEAKAKFEEAKLIDPLSVVVKQKLDDLSKKMSQAEAEVEKNKKFTEAFTAGMTALGAKDYLVAKEKFQAAIAIDGTKTEAKSKLEEVNKLIADNAAEIAKKEKYEAAVKAGNELMTAGKLNEAKVKFIEAQSVDPIQTLPATKITEIEGLLAKAEKDKQINQLIADGTALIGKKDLVNAKAKFNQVLAIDNANKLASDKLLEISKMEIDMAGEAEKEKRFNETKAAAALLVTQEKYPEARQKYLEAKGIKTDADIEAALKLIDQKIAEQSKNAALDQQFNQLMVDGRNLESAKNYTGAIDKYKEALKIKQSQEATDKIASLTGLLAANSEQEKINEQYNAAMGKGDALVQAKDYPAAIKAYEEARRLKPSESLPQTKIEEAERLGKEKSLSDEDILYQKIISAGQKAMDEKNWVKAKEMFNRALSNRPSDIVPKQKIEEIDAIIKKEKEDAEKLAAYQKKMSEASKLESEKKYDDAITAYTLAKGIKPDETLPDTKIAEIKSKMVPSVDPLAEQKARYTDAMQRGDAAATGKDYGTALMNYQEALLAIPKDALASSKVSEMKQILDDLAKNNAKEQLHQELLKKADGLFAAKQWLEAKTAYDEVLKNFPDDTYAKKQMELAIKNSENEGFIKEYQKLIAKADEKFNAKDYDRAKELYTRAITLNASDPYPKQKLKEIDALLNPPVVQTNVEPKGEELVLENLGTQVDNSVEDGTKRLQNAQDTRKGRISTRFFKKNQQTKDKTGELASVQNERAKQNDNTLDSVKVSNNTGDIKADEKRQENVLVMKDKEGVIIQEALTSNEVKTLTIQEQKSQINAANQTVVEQNALLDGSAEENELIIKQKKENLNQAEKTLTDQKTDEVQSNDKTLKGITIDQENSTQDDFEQRKKEEQKVLNAVEDNNVYHSEQAVNEHEENQTVKAKIVEFENEVKVKQDDEVKQSPLNKEKIIAIEEEQREQTDQDIQEKVENIKVTEKVIRSQEESQKVYGDSRKEDQQKSLVVIEKTRTEINEETRTDFNENYEKNLSNKQVIVNQVAEVDKRDNLPSIAAEKNKAAHTEITATYQESSENLQQGNQEKTLTNSDKIVTVQQEANSRETEESKKSNNNAEVIKNTKAELGTQELIQKDKQTEKTQESSQKITEIRNTKTEVVSQGKYEVDLNKYREGVNQEQFENYDKDGLLINIITRRVVVRNGKADIYVKTQTTDIATFTKNGEPCTEQTWIRETQDAKLVKNY